MRPEATALVDRLRAAVADERVLSALGEVPREVFVPAVQRHRAWDNEALPIASGQTISQPLVVARMCELLELRGDETVLDVGSGSGYHAAVLARLVRQVFGVEVHPELVELARRNLAAAGVTGVELHAGDGCRGLPRVAPFDAINVAAAGPGSRLAGLLEQLRPGPGRLVAPLTEPGGDQVLTVVRRRADGALEWTPHERVRFVPLVAGSGHDPTFA
jgi:protein-L-isoaspartate(D-aspartate) O-methyltransferase